ncbi:MAG: DUF2877 domain-containing protein [Pseudomonadota bacterium]
MESFYARGGEVVSVGDLVHPGSYPLHSRFNRVVNFSATDHLISLVNEDVGAGPSHIVVRNADLSQAGQTLAVTPAGAESGEIRLLFPEVEPFRSETEGDFTDEEMWNVVIRSLLSLASEKSAAFLLADSTSIASNGGFENNVAERIRTGAELLRSGEWLEGVRLLRGVGFGLTPTGDDLVAGFLTGLNLKRVPRDRIEELYAASLGENAISNSLLFFAKEGRLFEGTKRLLDAIRRHAVADIPPAVEGLLSRGATSGADFAVGLVLAIQQAT